ncbi:MAG: ATP-dependent zinc metalloprotease FtsH [Bacteroidaceae bacterium]|nr:ATP-dependent zinc metalloprotease FtsH [Bacteroidaceae bacterium]MDD7377332.1 ATP-dependent zinc metalloprotease FtsH [Prevotellaceae bacterium]
MNPQNPRQKQNMPKFNLNWVYFLILGALAFLYFSGVGGGSSVDREVDYTTFKSYVSKGYAKRMEVNKGDGTLKMFVDGKHIRDVFGQDSKSTGKAPTVTTKYPSVDKVEEFVDSETKAGHFKGHVSYIQDSNMFWNIIINLLPILLLVALWMFFMRRMGSGGGNGGVFSVGKSKAQLFEKKQGKHITFKDVAGQEGAKREVQEIVDFLKNPKKYTDLGGKIPRGALLVGPPGTGKTLLAKAVAGEADVPFFSISGSDFVEMFVGVGASRVRDLFRQAKEKAPSIIFIDEIDAVGRARGKNPSMGGNDERENTLNQLLTEMDGFSPNSGVIVMAATNRVDILDKALLRAGRFDRQIHVDLPDLNERKAIFLVHMKPLKMDQSVDVDLMARQTPGFSGADIANVCNEAALIAARNNKHAIEMQDFLDAVDRIIGGLEKKTKVMTQEEKHSIALHEAGHATISWFLQYASPLVKVTIVPRGQALGAAWYLPEERNITTKEQMEDEICATLGGRAAEELFTGHISTGALNDLETVTKRAYGMVAYLGMSEKLYNLCYYNNQEYQFEKPYSEKTAETIDSEVSALISRQYERAKQLLEEHKEGHAKLAALLEEREVIFAKDVEGIFGKRPWISRADEILQDEQEQMSKGSSNADDKDSSNEESSESKQDKEDKQ